MKDTSENLFIFAVVDTTIDFLVIKTPYCINCLKNKMGVNILSKFPILPQEARECKNMDVRIIRVICECNKSETR